MLQRTVTKPSYLQIAMGTIRRLMLLIKTDTKT